MLKALAAAVVLVPAGPNFPARLQTALVTARPGTIVELPAGRFDFQDELVIRASSVTLRGQGMDKTVLSFKNQVNGAQGLLATGGALTFQDFAIEDTPGDGLKLAGVDGATIRRVRVEWTRGPSSENGSYALYPVQSRNVLIEDSVARGASDAGIYVGQSEDIVVRRDLAELNVAGIEIENSHRADVYDNTAIRNTGGILVFALPNLPVRRSEHVRVFHNLIVDNNTPNFAAPGNIVGNVPAGTGMMVLAANDVQVFENKIQGQEIAPVAVVSYLITEIPIRDPDYDPAPRRVFVHDNVVERKPGFHLHPESRFNLLINVLFAVQGESVADSVLDGMGEKICFAGNKTPGGRGIRVANLQLDRQRRWLPVPGGPVLEDPALYACSLPPLAPVVFGPPRRVPARPAALSERETAALCGAPGKGPNWRALLTADCPALSQYRLSGGMPYDLTTPLFSDYATKHRVVYVPPGKAARYDAAEAFDFPVGTVISKTFGFGTPERVVETRLLVRRKDGWTGLPYVWREDHADAGLSLGGGAAQVDFANASGRRIVTRYAIPSANECASCHAQADGAMRPIGPKARLLNKGDQLARWTRAGILAGAPAPGKAPRLPAWDDPRDGTTALRARAYLEVNCAHCHSAQGLARNTGLLLDASVTDRTKLGICKPPVAAGLGAGQSRFDVVPGRPDQSILLARLTSNHPKVKMPQLSRSVVHDEGVALVRDWILGLEGGCGR